MRRRPGAQLVAAFAAFVTSLIAVGCTAPAGSQPAVTMITGAASPTASRTGVPASTTPGPGETVMTGQFTVTSPAFADGAAIPKRFTCDGDNVSPALEWAGVPDGAASLALVVSDPDAGDFTHWVVYDIDVSAAGGVQAGWSATADAAPQGENDFGDVGWGGPCPPSGAHHYVFRLLALDATLELRAGPSAADVLGAAEGHVLGEATLTGTYRRS